MKTNEYKPKFFPFSAGIPWKIERGKYIVPEVDSETWHQALAGRNIVITAFGGLFESFFSLAAAEALNSFDRSHRVSWLGWPQYTPLVRAQNLCQLSAVNLTPDMLSNYPTPIFFDQENRAYFNVLNNYLYRTSYWGKYQEPVNDPVVEQIFKNVMVPWRPNYTPKLRRLGKEFYEELCRTAHVHPRTKIVLFVLDSTGWDTLNWDLQNIKEFTQLASHKGLRVVVFTHHTDVFYGSKMLVYKHDMRKILQVMKESWMVFSTSVDWLLIALMISNAKVMGTNTEGPFELFKNAEALKAQNDIFVDRHWMSPIDAFTICEGLL